MLNFCWNLELLELKYFGNAKVSFLCGNNSKKVPAGGLWPEARGRRTSSATVNRRLAGPEAGVAVPPADNDSSRRLFLEAARRPVGCLGLSPFAYGFGHLGHLFTFGYVSSLVFTLSHDVSFLHHKLIL